MFIACSVARGLIHRVMQMFQIPTRPIGIEYAFFASIILFQCATCLSIACARCTRGDGWETTWAEKRARVVQELKKQQGSDVVFVRYRSDYDVVKNEWVFNDANIENSPIVWVRWGSADLNQKVLECYSDRRFWLLELDSQAEPQLSEL